MVTPENSIEVSHNQSNTSHSAVLICPVCGNNHLQFSSEKIHCQDCGTDFPLIGETGKGIPFLFADVNSTWQSWIARLNGINKQLDEKIDCLEKSLADKKNTKISISRIKKLIKHYQLHKLQINNLLEDFKQNDFGCLNNKKQTLAKNQGVDGYINNVFRDWCWENHENEELLSALTSVIPEEVNIEGSLLALGAGSSRLVFDFQRQYEFNQCVLLDINPLLLNVANKIINRETLELIEFPTAPLSIDDFALVQTCKMPDGYDANEVDKLEFILADATNIPYADKSFEVVLTPWLIDILPIDFRDFLPHINRVLKKGGYWLNTGSLAFFHNNEAYNYSQEEVLDLLQKYGFEIVASNRNNINYLCSPYSAHGRIENVFNFCVQKKYDCVPAKSFQYLPEWIANPALVIPNSDRLYISSSQHLLQAQILSAIDGKRSSEDIAKLIAREYDMPFDNAKAAVQQVLIDNYSSS